MNINKYKNKKMKTKQIIGRFKFRLSLVSIIAFVVLAVLSCSDDKQAGATGPDTRLDGKDKVLIFHNNPITNAPYTQTEINALGYDPAKEERYSQCHAVKLAIWTQQRPEKIVITKQGNKEEVTSIVNFVRNDRSDVSDYKEGYGYEGTWTATPASLGIQPNESASYDITVTYNDIGIDGFLTPSVRSTSFKISHYDDGKACIDLDKDLAGDWRFDIASNLTKATKGNDLVLAGGKIESAVAGITAGDGASLIDLGSWYEVNHGLSATGGGAKVNDYTLIMDINVPAASAGHYVNLVQPRVANDADGSIYINPSLGFWFNGGSSSWGGTIKVNTWHRIVISKESPNLLFYVDGVEILASPTLGSIDGKNAFSTAKFLLFADDGGEDYPIKVSQVMLFNKGFIGDHIKKFPKVGEQF
jgi:hypothetical protein